jgi:hypothetical protein
VLGNADLALYRAKAGGRNTFCFFNADRWSRRNRPDTVRMGLRACPSAL